MNNYTIKINPKEKTQEKKFVLRGREGELLGLLTVRDGEVTLNGTAKLSPHTPADDNGETKVF